MRFWLSLTISAFLLVGCTTNNTTQPYTPSTYNVASGKKSTPTKSTATYPGSEKITTQVKPSSPQNALPEQSAPVVIEDTAIKTTTLAMATPTPSTSVETPSSSTTQEADSKESDATASTSGSEAAEVAIIPTLAAPMPKPLNDDSTMIKIAVLVPQKTIKKYAISSVNSVIAYLLYKNYYFDLNVFNTGDERDESIAKALADIKAGGYQYIIAPVTAEGANVIASRVQDTPVFIPTLHRSSVSIANSNIIFGGIDYDQQIALLTKKANERVGTFEDGSNLSYQLNSLIKKNTSVFFEKRVESSKANFRAMFKGNSSLNNASLYLNTPLVTSSLIASQLRANDIRPYALLSTQINYNPLILTLTQYEDRDEMIIANSIQKAPAALEEINAMFGHDIVYDWVNYSTSIGADYLCQQFFDGKVARSLKEGIVNNQVVYNTSLYQPGRNEFKRLSN